MLDLEQRTPRWDRHFMRLAREASYMSKDPSTKVGVTIVQGKRVVGSGWNGFPPQIADDSRLLNRDTKMRLIVHAEMNALLDAGRDSEGSVLYLYGFRSPPCTNCLKHVIAARVRGVIACGPPVPERWENDLEHSSNSMREAGLWIRFMDELDLDLPQ